MKLVDLSERTNMFYWQTNRKLTPQQTKEIFLSRHQTTNNRLVKVAVEHGLQQAGYSKKEVQVKSISPIIKLGSVNTVVPITLADGKQVVIRMHPRHVRNGYFWVEAIATKLAKEAGVPTYTTITVDDSQSVVPFDFMIMTKESGSPIQEYAPLPTNLEKKLVTETGRLTALIHAVKVNGFGFFKNEIAHKYQKLTGQYKTFKQHIYAALDEDLDFLVVRKTMTEEQRSTIKRIFNSHESLLECTKGVLVHNDIADWNELTDGKHITGIMDWDECIGADPLMEFAAYSLFYGEPRLTWFKQGYQTVRQLENNEDKFQLFKLRYLISKLHLRTKRSLVDRSPLMRQNIARGIVALREVFSYFRLNH